MTKDKPVKFNNLPKHIKVHRRRMGEIIKNCKEYLRNKKIDYDNELHDYLYKLKSIRGRRFVNCDPIPWEKVYK